MEYRLPPDHKAAKNRRHFSPPNKNICATMRAKQLPWGDRMNTHRAAKLAQAITEMQARWGAQAVCTLREAAAPQESLPTGFPALDDLTGIGGVPVGHISALDGQPTSGATTLAYHLAASAQRQMRTVIWLDVNRTFDPASASAAGVDFQQLLLSRPADWPRALAITRDITAQLLHTLIVLPLPLTADPRAARLLTDLLRLLPPICHRNGNTLVLKGAIDGTPWQAVALSRAALVIQLRRSAWLPDSLGFTTQVAPVKNRFAPPASGVTLAIVYPERP